jgi:8-oxo-dGTP pyrophosphatase MutT (NUDIX family)
VALVCTEAGHGAGLPGGRIDDGETPERAALRKLHEELGLALPPAAEVASVHRVPLGSAWVAAPTAAFLYQFREWLLLGRAMRVAHCHQPGFAWR